MKWYQEKFTNRRNWILEHIEQLNLNTNEAMLVLMIDFYNEFSTPVDLIALAHGCGMSDVVADETVNTLVHKGYLTITEKKRQLYFNIDSIFEEKKTVSFDQDVFETFESEFGRPLSQREMMQLAEMLKAYGNEKVVLALRDALINNVKNLNYVDKILSQRGKDNE